MALPTITQVAPAQFGPTLVLAALFSDGQIMLGRDQSSGAWKWETVNVPIPGDSAPQSLAYAQPTAILTKGHAISANIPTIVSGVQPVYSVSPALPTGMHLNTATGLITGTPTAVTSVATYTVTATNAYGTTTAALVFTIVDEAPLALSYSSQPLVYTKDTAITSLHPVVYGGEVVSYAITPALPTGLALDTTTGILSGTPSVLHTHSSFTITATNSGGSVSCSIAITVNDVAPSAMTYNHTPVTYAIADGAITTNTPTHSGGTVVSYSISPALPAGLSMSTTTGLITGTPTAAHATTVYTVTATNTGGSTNATLVLTVTE